MYFKTLLTRHMEKKSIPIIALGCTRHKHINIYTLNHWKAIIGMALQAIKTLIGSAMGGVKLMHTL